MKINQMIREKRKELSLTQEQVADFLGVSTPAVNKWEKGSSYPDITLLPALARLLKTDLNTLMSFLYKRLAASEISEIRDTASSMLISYARNREDFSKAEELINALPFSTIDKEEQLAVLYQQQERYKDAEKIWEHRGLKGVTEIQTALIYLLETALLEKRANDAEYFADMYEMVTRQFCFPEWVCCNGYLQIALATKDRDKCLAILRKRLSAMKREWNLQNCQLYRHAKDTGNTTFLFSRDAESLCTELSAKEEYAFIREGSEFEEMMGELSFHFRSEGIYLE